MKEINNRNKKTLLVTIIVAIIFAALFCVGTVGFIRSNVASKNLKANGDNGGAVQNPQVVDNGQNNQNASQQTGTVTVYYVDENGRALTSEPLVKTGTVGEWYEVERINIPQYTTTGEEPMTRAGYYEAGNKDVIFKYKPAGEEVRAGASEDGKEVNVVFNNTKITTDYGVRIITKDNNGNAISGARFSIGKDSIELANGTVINGELYLGKLAIGESGNIVYDLSQTEVPSGYKKIDGKIGLTLNSSWDDNNKKFVLNSASTDKNGTSATIDSDRHEVIIEIVNNKISDMYEMEFIYLDGSNTVNGAKLKVEKSNQLVKEEKITNGKLEIKDIAIEEAGNDVYEISETEAATGYESALKDGKKARVAVTKTLNSGNYTITAGTNDSGISVRTDGNVVTVYIQTKKIDEPDDKYDLAIMKFVSEVDGAPTNGREPTVSVSKGEQRFSYNKKNDMERVANSQKVTFRLRMYNESLEDGRGKRIIEDIPDGLVYLPENETNKKYNWKGYIRNNEGDLVAVSDISQATAIATDYLVDKEIKGYNKEAVDSALDGHSESSATKYLNFEDVEIVYEVRENKITNPDRIIENTVTIQKNENDDNDKNDRATERLYVKYFDLDVSKFIEEIKVKNEKEDKVIKVGEEKKGQMVKIDVAKSQANKTTITVKYGVRVKNIGEIAGYVTEIVDFIPDDFELVEDDTWKLEGKNAVTTKLENTILEPNESTVIYITFNWKLKDGKIGERFNESKITKYENIYNAKDPTEDNNDKEGFLVSIRTGSKVIITITTCVAVIAALAVVVIIRRKSRKDA